MPACDARYDVVFNDGSGIAVGHSAHNRAVVDFLEERLPDDWGEPGPLVAAALQRWWASPRVRSITYERIPSGRKALWVDGSPRRTHANRRYLRWQEGDWEPPPHPEYDEPA